MCKLKFIMASMIAIMLNSCVSAPKFEQYVGFIDYVKIADEYNVFVTEANSVSFDYSPVGSIDVTEISGMKEVPVVSSVPSDTIKSSVKSAKGYSKTKSLYVLATPESAVCFAAKKAKEMGGNGIINLDIQFTVHNNRPAYVVSGMVIKRKLQ